MIRTSIDASHFNERLDRARQGIPLALTSTAAGLGGQYLDRVRSGLPAGPLADGYEISLEQRPDAVLAQLTNSQPEAAFYEFGFQGTEQVSEHLRMMTQAFGKPVATPHEVLVRAYSRTVDAPAHGPATQALEQMTPEIIDGFTQAILKELSP